MFYWPWLGLNGAKTGPVCSVGGRPCPGRCTCLPGSLLGKCWRERWVVLYEDSTLAWFRAASQRRPDGWLRLRDSAASGLLAVAKWTLRIPTRPSLPTGSHVARLLALGRRGAAMDIIWLLASSERDASDWIAAISTTLAPLAPHLQNCTGLLTTEEQRQLAAVEEAERRRQMSGETPLSMVGDMAVASTLNEIHWGVGKAWLCTHNSGYTDIHNWHIDHIDTDVIADGDYSFDCDIMF